MVVSGRYIDGRHGVTGAQYVNAARGTSGRTDNARFGATGTITVEKRSGVAAGEEILMAYGQDYWRQRDAEARKVKRDERVGGFAAYSKHDGGRVIFIEEIVCAPTARGRQLGVGRQLFRRVVGAAGHSLEEIHLGSSARQHACEEPVRVTGVHAVLDGASARDGTGEHG